MAHFNILLTLVVLVAPFAYAVPLICNQCIGSVDSDCARGENMMSQHCIDFDLPSPIEWNQVSYCFNMTLKDNAEHSSGVSRGCGHVQKGFDYCSLQSEYTSCYSCSEDFCN